MPSISPDFAGNSQLLRLSTSVGRIVENSGRSNQLLRKNADDSQYSETVGKFTWPSGATYEGEFSGDFRNGHGKQTWPDGSVYEGAFFEDMRHGHGVHKWKSGEVYEGQFYKDHRHGYGSYSWKDGTKYTGTFYLDRKEGYGTFTFSNGDQFEGLYKADERFGPGVLRYKDPGWGDDVGMWHREKLLRFCIPVDAAFTMKDHPEYEYFPDEHHSRIDLTSDKDKDVDKLLSKGKEMLSFLKNDYRSLPFYEHTALPPGIETYSKDFEHLPLTYKRKEEFDKAFYGDDYELSKGDASSFLIASNNTPLMMEIQKHTYKYRKAARSLSFNVDSINSNKHEKFNNEPGYLETISKNLIEKSTEGDTKVVYSILKSDLADPNVSDCDGNMALVGAAMNCHHDIVNLLLDMGANVNQVTDEGISALSACHIFYYPVDHFKPNIAENAIQKFYKKLKYNSRKESEKEQSSDKKFEPPSSPISDSCDLNQDEQDSHLNETEKEEHIEIMVSRENDDEPVIKLSCERFMGDSEDTKLNIETCKSDVRIMKANRDTRSAKSRGLYSEMRSLKFEDEFDNLEVRTIISEETDADSNAESRMFISNENVVEYDVCITDDLITKTAALLSLNHRAVSGVSTRDGKAIRLGTAGALAVWKAEHTRLNSMIELLLRRGGSPNIGAVPFPALFFAVKAGDVDAVKLLLQKGASTEYRLSDKLGGLTSLHIASGITCPEGVRIVELLLSAGANPNTTANDENFISSSDDGSSEASFKSTQSARWKTTGTQWMTEGLKYVTEGGRTSLHIACERDDNYEFSRDIVHLLLDYGANPDVIWNGHSPLSLSICSGNDHCVNELLQYGSDASLPLTRNIGNALCVGADPQYEEKRSFEGRIQLIDKLVEMGANMLAPVTYGGTKKVTGTVIDYAYWMFGKDERIAHTPYHALNLKERETYTARKDLLAHLGSLLRAAAVDVERKRIKKDFKAGVRSVSPSRQNRFLYVGTGADVPRNVTVATSTSIVGRAQETSRSQNVLTSHVSFAHFENKDSRPTDGIVSAHKGATASTASLNETSENKKSSSLRPVRKPLFRYCYDCGRSVGVRLTSCSRCREVFYCSRACKMKAWEERHKDECLRMKAAYREESPLPSTAEIAEIFAEHKLDETMERAEVKTTSIIDTILSQHRVTYEESNQVPSRRSIYGSRSAYGRKTSLSSRGQASSAKSRRTFSSRSEKIPSAKRLLQRKKQNPAKVSAGTRGRVGKDVTFNNTGTTLAELGITENYSFN